MQSWCRGGQAHRVFPAPRGQPSPSAAPTHCAAVTSMMAARGTEPGAASRSHQCCSSCSLNGRNCAVNRCWGSPWEMPPPATQPPGSVQHPGPSPCCHPISMHITEIDSLCRDPSCSPDQHSPAGTALWTQPPRTPQLTGTPRCHGIHTSHTETPARGEQSSQHLFLGYHTKYAEHSCR